MLRRCVVMLLLLAGFATPVLSQSPLPQTTVDLLRAANIAQDALTAVVVRLGDGTVMLAHDAGRSLQPASTLKVLTAIVALDRLGPAWRAHTEMLSAGTVRHGRLDGDLVLRGGGSPDFDWRALERMLHQLRFQGITRISGDVVLDRGLFHPPRRDTGVPPFDETPEFRYNVIPDALLLNTNLVQLDLASNNRKVRAQMTPPLQRVSVEAGGMETVDRPCALWEDGWKLPSVVHARGGGIRIILHGEFPAQCNATTNINVLDRVEFADRLFRALWKGMGGRFDGRVRDGAAPPGAVMLAEHASRGLAEIIRDVNKRSDNPITRQLYLTLGTLPDAAATTMPADTALRAERVVRAWLADRHIDADGLVLENGSGLSRVERISPTLLANVLIAATASEWAPEFLSTLPIVGVDAAMTRRLADSPAAGNARFKTGTLRNVVSVAGYVRNAAGQLCVVVAIINQEPSGEGWVKSARSALDSLIEWVARSGS